MPARIGQNAKRRYFLSRCDPSLRLTAHNIEILAQLSRGKKANEIALSLGIVTDTVYEQIGRARRRLGAHNIPELVRLAIKHGFINA